MLQIREIQKPTLIFPPFRDVTLSTFLKSREIHTFIYSHPYAWCVQDERLRHFRAFSLS